MSQADLLVQADQAIARGDFGAASNLCAQLLQDEDNNRAAALLLARICLGLGKEDSASMALAPLPKEQLEAFISEVDAGSPARDGECHLAAFAAEQLGQFETGIRLARRAIQAQPKRVDERVVMVRLLRLSGDLETAFEELMNLADINVTHTAVQREAARWFTAAGKYDEALAQYRQVLSVFPGEKQSRAERWALKQRLNQAEPYCSDAGQDEYVHQTFFRDVSDGSFIDLDTSADAQPSNTAFFRQHLDWRGVYAEACSDEELVLLLENSQLLAPSFVACSSYEGAGLLEKLDLRRYQVGVLCMRKPSETLKQRLKQRCYTLDITVADDEIWYHPQLVSKTLRR